jgi:hypothetical protein
MPAMRSSAVHRRRGMLQIGAAAYDQNPPVGGHPAPPHRKPPWIGLN